MAKKNVLVVAIAFIALFPGLVFSQTPFYQGKTITFVRGAGPGGVGEARARAVIPYLNKYIPGNPHIVLEFMPGGGGSKAANYLFSRARPDGLTLGSVGGGLVRNAVLGLTGAEYDIDKFIYLGSPESGTHYVFFTRKEAGLDNLKKLLASTGLKIGGQEVGHDIYVTGRLFAYLMGLKDPKFIAGYTGPELDMAQARGEVDARGQTVDGIEQRNPEWIHKRLVDFHAVIEVPKGSKHPHLGHLPEIETFARSENERRLMALFRNFKLVGTTHFLPPGTPRDRVEILAEAMRKTFRDPKFLADYKKMSGGDASPLMPEEQVKAIKDIPRDAETIGLFNKLAGAGPLPTR
jgi:tripartite-type tricarboxylate transporter receptor subunit TctC